MDSQWKILNPPAEKKNFQDFQDLWWEVYFCYITQNVFLFRARDNMGGLFSSF